MAHYTELLAEYLKGGRKLPAAFAKIEGFEELFIGTYGDYEIGFETEDLFELKLETKANLVIDIYKQRIDILTQYWTKAKNPTKTFYDVGSTTMNLGEQKTASTELPIEGADYSSPSMTTISEPTTNKDNRENRHEETGETAEELMRVIEKLNTKVHNVIMDLLEEFKPLFMGVY